MILEEVLPAVMHDSHSEEGQDKKVVRDFSLINMPTLNEENLHVVTEEDEITSDSTPLKYPERYRLQAQNPDPNIQQPKEKISGQDDI